MKKLLLLFLSISISVSAMGQLVGGNTYPINGTDNGTTSFASLRSAIAYLQTNGVTGTGQVVLEFTSSYDATLVDGPAAGATKITIPAITGTSATLGITIRPASGFTTSLSANVDASGLIDLDGASYITIDGRQGGSGASGLTIENLNAGTAAGTAAIRFVNDAHHNVITYCTLKSATTNNAYTAGTVLFGSSTGTTGNSYNTISNNAFSQATGVSRAAFHVASFGSATVLNAENEILNNNISNYTFRAISLFSGTISGNDAGLGDNWKISGNSIYSTAGVNGTLSYGISVLGTTAGHTISNNYIGGQAPQCGGNAMATFGFVGIYITSSAFGTTSLVQNNTIANISANYTSTGLTANTSIHQLIYVSGNVDVLNNTLGSQTNTNNITLSTSNAQEFGVFATPIYVAGAGTINIKNNLVGGITYNPTGVSTQGYYARLIYVNATSLASLTIENNIFGGSVANSIQNTGTARAVFFQGIYTAAIAGAANIKNNTMRNITGTTNVGMIGIYLNANIEATVSGNTLTKFTSTGGGATSTLVGISTAGASGAGLSIKSNTISDLITNGTATTNTSTSVLAGISVATTGVGVTLTDNVVYNLTCTGAAVTHVMGIGSFGGRQISGNKIYNLYNTNATAGGTIKGVVLRQSGTFNAYNNIISLTGVNNDVAVYGFETNGTVGTAANIFHNTVHIAGTIPAGTSVSAAVFTGTTTPINAKNNILSISRTGGSGTHVAINNAASAATTNDYNLYIYPSATASEPNSVAFNYGDVGKPVSPVAFFADNSSPYYMSVLAANDSYFKAKGTPIGGLTTDIGNNARSATTPSLGAYEANTATLLPVNISTFVAKLNNNSKVILDWTVGTETNVSRYEIERSSNGVDFVKTAQVTANGSSSYTAIDNNPALGINYYRLKGVDNDGTLSPFSELRTVKLVSLEAKQVSVYPNPLVGNTINISLSNFAKGSYVYKLTDIAGKSVQQGDFANTGSESSAITIVNSLPKGIYILQVVNGIEVIQSKLIKQ